MITNNIKTHLSNSEMLTSKSLNEISMTVMLEVYKSVSDARGFCYCSAPVTSGKRYFDWLERIGKQLIDIDSADENYRQLHFKEVIEPNCQHAQRIIQKLRQQTGTIVVDPTALPCMPDWTQQDWRSFWRQVIERYVTTAFFINDWQYSNGCVYEFWVAYKKRISVFDETQNPINLITGINLIVDAISFMKQRGVSTVFAEDVLQDIKSLLSD